MHQTGVDILQSGDRQHFSVSVFEVLLDDLMLKVRVVVVINLFSD